jgi:hypothetical protein
MFLVVFESFSQGLSDKPSMFNYGAGGGFNGENSRSGGRTWNDFGGRAGEYWAGSFPGATLIPINVWGATKSTGLFRVPKTTTLIELLSYAQGPSNDAKLNKVKIKRTSEKIEKTFTVDVEELIENPAAHDIPLMANDIVYVEPKRQYVVDPQISNTIGIVATIMGIVAAGYLIKERSRN